MRRFNSNQAKMMLDSFAIIHNRVIHFRFIYFINSSATTDILISSDDDTAQLMRTVEQISYICMMIILRYSNDIVCVNLSQTGI